MARCSDPSEFGTCLGGLCSEAHGGAVFLPSQPLLIQADLVKEDDCNKIIQDTVNKFGKLDVLVNSRPIFFDRYPQKIQHFPGVTVKNSTT